MGKPGAGTHRRPQAFPQACSQLQGTWGDKLMAASLLRRQEAADFSTAAPDSSTRRPPGARAWRQAAVRPEQVSQRPPSLIPASPGGGCGRDGHHPRACTALPEDSQGRVRGLGVPQAAGPGRRGSRQLGLSSTVLGLKSSSPRSLGPQFCTEAGARGMSPTLAGACSPASSSPEARRETPDPNSARGPGSGAPE